MLSSSKTLESRLLTHSDLCQILDLRVILQKEPYKGRVEREEVFTGQTLVFQGLGTLQRSSEMSRVKSQKILISEDTIFLLVIYCANYSLK